MATPTVYRADCYFGEDEWRRVRVDGWFTCFCDRAFEPGRTYCARGETVYAEPLEATTPLQNNVRGKIVVIKRGTNTFFEKAQHAVNAGAAGVIYVNTDDNEPPAFTANDGEHVQIPCVVVKKSWLTAPGARVGAEWTITVATMGPSGTVDFQALVEGFQDVNQQFDDHAFPANLNSIFLNYTSPLPGYTSAADARRMDWKRPQELHAAPKLFIGGAVPNDIIQGCIGNCYFLSAAAILCSDSANEKSEDILKKLFVKTQYFEQGLVGIRFFKNGKWLDIAIDTRIPCLDGKPQFVKMKDLDEFWMIMLEKAYAKLHGSYEMLDAGSMDDALADMTGGAPGSVGIVELFSAARGRDGRSDKLKAMHLLEKRAHGQLFQGASCDGGSEQPIGDCGLYAGHAYSINSVKQTSTGEILVCLRNPWGRLEWNGAWSDKDTRNWTPALKTEMNFTDEDDGTFFMSISDFMKRFTTLTYVDLVPKTFFVYRVEGSWKGPSAGDADPYDDKAPTDLTITLSQPDGKMAAAPDRKLHEAYQRAICFEIFSGGQHITKWNNKTSARQLKESACKMTRSVSLDLRALAPGDYIVMPSTFEKGHEMDFYMRFYCSQDIDLAPINTPLTIGNASSDQLDKQAVPTSLAAGMSLQDDAGEASPLAADEVAVLPHIKKLAADENTAFDFGVTEDGQAVNIWPWVVGERIPEGWKAGDDYIMSTDSKFSVGEIVAVNRSDGSIRFARVTEGAVACPKKHLLGVVKALPQWTCDLCKQEATPGDTLYDCRICDWDACEKCRQAADKGIFTLDVGNGVTKPAKTEHLGKLPSEGGIPRGLRNKISGVFDVLDADGSGFLEVQWGEDSELAGDAGKRLLAEMNVPKESRDDMYAAMKELDANKDGKIDREEFVTWFAKKALANY
eukprot:CAMPEP_0177744362 /NCGR_PEP_ID=MMETSP0484_2-20121128/29704_1 /TAXON_ID=354590 /ORGANISM="Rhodomonas lens, Strain RHODO" /LENGTH=905 /DNA_ID=CAMNT_0019258857 /DNA_START=25 /DNA_END=2743 /DNA_ORIENTATION=+